MLTNLQSKEPHEISILLVREIEHCGQLQYFRKIFDITKLEKKILYLVEVNLLC